ncbi:NACHT nucleoside triphosphatase [Sarocladium implicatum]|nr:NACHT nucleoside triphosphatase [Sarocladium implicatum]
MDPITAVALSGNILQFLQFTGGLLNSAGKLHASSNGTSDANDHLHDICSKLTAFTPKLHCPQQQQPADTEGLQNNTSQHSVQLSECATACQGLCGELLKILEKLKAVGTRGSRHWGSFHAALLEVWHNDNIESLRRRITDYQGQMTLILSAVANESIALLDYRIRDVAKGIWNLQSDSRLSSVLVEIRSLQDQLNSQTQGPLISSNHVSTICDGFSKLSLEAQSIEGEAQVLRSLNYTERTARQENIPIAHEGTFLWSFEPSSAPGDGYDQAQYGKLKKWLHSSEALFWVSGKPGSGKSTFMKYIAGHRQTKRCLQTWAGSQHLLIASHFFTAYGSPIQRSLEGLLRSLAFSILVQKPELISGLLRHRWKQSSEDSRMPAEPWTQHELENLLRCLGQEVEHMPRKVCFFIDGLDEYDGDHIDICQTLKQFAQSPSIKVCVSSRPWNVFEDALGGKADAKVYMHQLTNMDIRNYTKSRLEAHPRYGALQTERRDAISSALIDEVVDKSHGVFLWVVLVLHQLREGLTNDDTLMDLRRRLLVFPDDLDAFFNYIVDSVDPFYKRKMACTLSIALEAEEPLPLEIYYFRDMELDNEGYALEEATDAMPEGPDLEEFHDTIARRMNGRCKGLMERSREHMVFLHRTVYDFLRTKKMSEFLEKESEMTCIPHLSIFRAYIAWIKRSHSYRDQQQSAKGFRYARFAEQHDEVSAAQATTLLDSMEQSLNQDHGVRNSISAFIAELRRLILEAGLWGYIRTTLTTKPRYFFGLRPYDSKFPFYLVLLPEEQISPGDQLWILKTLLSQVPLANPNASYDDWEIHDQKKSFATWEMLFEFDQGDADRQLSLDDLRSERVYQIKRLARRRLLLALLEHGADSSVLVKCSSCRKYAEPSDIPIWLVFLFGMLRLQPQEHKHMKFGICMVFGNVNVN